MTFGRGPQARLLTGPVRDLAGREWTVPKERHSPRLPSSGGSERLTSGRVLCRPSSAGNRIWVSGLGLLAFSGLPEIVRLTPHDAPLPLPQQSESGLREAERRREVRSPAASWRSLRLTSEMDSRTTRQNPLMRRVDRVLEAGGAADEAIQERDATRCLRHGSDAGPSVNRLTAGTLGNLLKRIVRPAIYPDEQGGRSLGVPLRRFATSQ